MGSPHGTPSWPGAVGVAATARTSHYTSGAGAATCGTAHGGTGDPEAGG